MPTIRDAGPVKLLSDEPATARLNLRLPKSTREKLDERAKASGISPTEMIKRWVEDAPMGTEPAVEKAVQSAISRYFGEGIPLSLEGISREQLSETARELGFNNSAQMLKALASKTIQNPSAIKSLLFDEMKADAKTRAKTELAARTKKAKL